MLLYIVRGLETNKTESKNPKVARTKKGRIMLLLKCAVHYSKKIKIYQIVNS